MKTKLLFVFFTISLLSLTSCGFKQEISKEKFIEKANNTTNYTYKKATVTCKGTYVTEQDEKEEKETINRDFNFTYAGGWRIGTSNSYSDFEKNVAETALNVLRINVRDVVKNEPFTKEESKGLSTYDNPLSFTYRVQYVNAKDSITVDGITITGTINGPETQSFSFNKYGVPTSYAINNDLVNKLSYQGYSMSFHSSIKLRLKIAYSDE